MANLPLAFGELLGGGILLVAGVTGTSIADTIDGNVTMHPLSSGGGGASTAGGGPGDGKGMFPGATFSRTDQGVDFTMQPGDPIKAPASLRLVGIQANWYSGQPMAWYQLLDGPDVGKYLYIAEQVSIHGTAGATFNPGDTIATFAASGTGGEAGWATSTGETLAQATTGYVEGVATKAGQDFRKWLGV